MGEKKIILDKREKKTVELKMVENNMESMQNGMWNSMQGTCHSKVYQFLMEPKYVCLLLQTIKKERTLLRNIYFFSFCTTMPSYSISSSLDSKT